MYNNTLNLMENKKGKLDNVNFNGETNKYKGVTLAQFGEIIKLKRKELGLNQTQLAEKADLHQPDVSRVENGEKVGAEVLDKITTALGITLPLTYPRR